MVSPLKMKRFLFISTFGICAFIGVTIYQLVGMHPGPSGYTPLSHHKTLGGGSGSNRHLIGENLNEGRDVINEANVEDSLEDSQVPENGNQVDEILKVAGALNKRSRKAQDCDISKFVERDAWDKKGKRKDLAICTIIRNEAKNLEEWVAFHWLQGAGKIIIYDDASTDNPYSILEKFIKLGLVEYIHVSSDYDLSGTEDLQFEKMNECLELVRTIRQRAGLRFVLFSDLDEFTYPVQDNRTLSDVLNREHDREPCLLLPRTYYGTSLKHRTPSSGLVIENYFMRSPIGDDGFPKVVVHLEPSYSGKKNLGHFSFFLLLFFFLEISSLESSPMLEMFSLAYYYPFPMDAELTYP